MIKEIKYKGITRVPSDRDSFDGELEESINLKNVAGELRPYIHPEIIGFIDGDIVFVHKNSGYEHFISIKGSDIKASNYKNDEITDLGIITNIYGENIRKIESVGNTLIFITDKEIKYSLWVDDSYTYLGNKIPFPVLSVNTNTIWHEVAEIGADQKYSNIIDNPSLLSNEAFYESDLGKDFMNYYWAYVNKNYTETINAGYITFPVFVRYAVRLYDGTLINHSMPFLIIPGGNAPNNFFMLTANYDLKEIIARATLSVVWQLQNLSNWSDIISSIDIFVSPQIWYYPEGAKLRWLTGTQIPSAPGGKIQPVPYPNLSERIVNVGNFYLVKSISLDDFHSTLSANLEIGEPHNLTAKELMTDDYLSHDTITAENSFTYNNKLHLSGIQRSKFPGFQFKASSSTEDDRVYYDGTPSESVINIGRTPFIFYPGKCEKVYLFVKNDRNFSYFNVINLTPHPVLNGSYYLTQDYKELSPSNPGSEIDNENKFNNAVSEGIKKSIVVEYDKIYVSAHQNPFLFPVNSRITLPVGKIIGMSSNTEAISQGQFGQFPLYVFTNDGVWALEIDSQGKYMARQPVSRDVCTNPNILQMDKHIGFITEKGLVIMSGANSECITDIIRENNIRTSKIPISEFLTATGSGSFAQIYNTDNIEVFMKGCSLAYEYINGKGRIFMVNKNYPYSYVFDIESKSWGKIESSFSRAVNNYPDCYVQDKDGQILNLASLPVSTERKKCLFVTRAISLSDSLFLISKLAHRGIFKGGVDTVVYGSRNGIDYTPVASNKNPLMAIRGTPYRYFKIAVISSMFPTDSISGCTIDTIEKFTNRLR